MHIPLAILRKHADEALASFAASSGLDPEEVWGAMVAAQETIPEVLSNYLEGESLWERFLNLRQTEIEILKTLRP